MILTVAIISPATTGLKAGSVANVIASSTRLRRSIASLSTTSTPAVSANRLARPVKARSTCTPSPATAAAISAAAASSDTSPGSSRATTISAMPAASSAAISAWPISVPFLSTRPPWRIEWTATAPSASADRHRAELHERLLRRLAQPRRDLAHDGDRDLGGRDRADVEPDRRMDARDRGVGQALRLQPLDAAGVGLLRAERADIEAVARERMGERGIVDLRIVGERDEGGVAVDAERRQRHVRPFGDHLHVGKALGRGEGGARIDDGHVVAEKPARSAPAPG